MTTISTSRCGLRLLHFLGCILLLTASVEAGLVDGFDDESWNADGHWSAHIIQGQDPGDAIHFDEAVSPGLVAIDYDDSATGDQITLLLRDDVTLGVGEWVQVEVAIIGGPETVNVRMGLGLAASAAPPSRANTVLWGVRHDGLGRGHLYGDGGVERGDVNSPISNYGPGQFFTLALHRVSSEAYDFYIAPTGQALAKAGSGALTNAADTPPMVPGLLLDNGLASFNVLVDHFEVGAGWPPPVREARPVATPLPTLPTDVPGGEVALLLPPDIMDLPRLESTRHAVHMPTGDGDNTYHHNALLTWWKGRFYMAWTSAAESEATFPYEAWVSSSVDGESWETPFDVGVAADNNSAYEAYMRDRLNLPTGEMVINAAPRGWHATEDKLYLWSLGFTKSSRGTDWEGRVWWTDDGNTWQEMDPAELNRLEAQQSLLVRNSSSNKGFIELSDGRWMAAALEGYVSPTEFRAAPITADPTCLTGWSGGLIDTSDCADVGEPNGWESPDGILHYTARFGTRIWHSYSEDRGQTWTKLKQQQHFTDNPGNKKFGTLPDGRIYYIGGPVPGSRMELVLGVSDDGWIFDDNYLVRWETISPIWYSTFKSEDRPGYEYPTLLYHEGYLYAAYSRTRDFIEVSKIPAVQVLGSSVRNGQVINDYR